VHCGAASPPLEASTRLGFRHCSTHTRRRLSPPTKKSSQARIYTRLPAHLDITFEILSLDFDPYNDRTKQQKCRRRSEHSGVWLLLAGRRPAKALCLCAVLFSALALPQLRTRPSCARTIGALPTSRWVFAVVHQCVRGRGKAPPKPVFQAQLYRIMRDSGFYIHSSACCVDTTWILE
jgi:hypothetical protein